MNISHQPTSLGQSYDLTVSIGKHSASIYLDYKADKRLLRCLQVTYESCTTHLSSTCADSF
jgi:hypothetical protein